MDPSAAQGTRRPRGAPGRLRGAGLAAAAVVVAVLALRAAHRPNVDLAVYHRAGQVFAAGGELYRVSGEAYPYRYAPGVAALFAPLSALPFRTACAVWAAVNAAILLAAVLALDRAVGARRALAAPLALALLVQPIVHELAHGQVDLLVLALALAAFACDDRGRPAAAGALVAVAAALKVAPALLALDWLVRRRWRPLAGTALGGALVAAAPLPLYGIAGTVALHRDWIRSQAADAAGMLLATGNQSLWSAAARLGVPHAAAAAACALLLAVLLSERDGARRRWLLLAAIPLVSAYGWTQLFVVALPLLGHLLAVPGWRAAAAFALAAPFTLLGHDVAGARVEVWAQDHRLLCAALVALVLLGRYTPSAGAARADASARRAGAAEESPGTAGQGAG